MTTSLSTHTRYARSTTKFVRTTFDEFSSKPSFGIRDVRRVNSMGRDTAERFVGWLWQEGLIENAPGYSDSHPLFRLVPQV